MCVPRVQTRAADPPQRGMVEATLDAAAALGLRVLRMWAFSDGPDQYMSLQPRPGQHVEAVLQGLDWLLAAARARGLRLMLCLTNNWHDFGGVPQYVRWVAHG